MQNENTILEVRYPHYFSLSTRFQTLFAVSVNLMYEDPCHTKTNIIANTVFLDYSSEFLVVTSCGLEIKNFDKSSTGLKKKYTT